MLLCDAMTRLEILHRASSPNTKPIIMVEFMENINCCLADSKVKVYFPCNLSASNIGTLLRLEPQNAHSIKPF